MSSFLCCFVICVLQSLHKPSVYLQNHKVLPQFLTKAKTMTTSTSSSLFETAIAALYSSEHQARTKEALEKAAPRRTCTIQDMRAYMRRATIVLPASVAIVHITGTKGKGSTACLCESILRESGGKKTGLFTSPHLVNIRERIRLGGRPVSEEVFGQAYWTVRRQLEENSADDYDDELPVLPGYFRMMALLAYYIFANYVPALDVIILEVGMGGRYDATNIFDFDDRRVACGITLLDLDHTRVLGDSIEQIAWEKGGIFKIEKGSTKDQSPKPCDGEQAAAAVDPDKFPSSERRFYAIGTNTPSALKVLEGCAALEGRGAQLCVVDEDPDLADIVIGLPGSHQRINAALALTLCRTVCDDFDEGALHQALVNAVWPGRCQTVQARSDVNLRLDGAHTPKSLAACLEWFEEAAPATVRRILIFNCSHERNPVPLLQQLHDVGFCSVYFCPADFERPSGMSKRGSAELLESSGFIVNDNTKSITNEDFLPPTWQETLGEVWASLDLVKGTSAIITPNLTVKEALADIMSVKDSNVEVLVAGSLYLVGSALEAIEWKEADAVGGLLL